MTKFEEHKAKKWLLRARNAKLESDTVCRQIEETKTAYTSITGSISGMPSGGTHDPHKLDNYVARIEYLQNKANKLEGTINEVQSTIDCIEDEMYRKILVEHYIEGDSWETISNRLHYSYEGGYIYVLRRKALEALIQYIEIQ